MNIKIDLIKSYIVDCICNDINDFGIDADRIADTKATEALAEIKQVLHKNKLDDFEMVEEIVCIFEKYNLDAGCCHDF